MSPEWRPVRRDSTRGPNTGLETTMTIDVLRRMFAHMQWADRRVLDLAERDPGAVQPVMHVLAHLVASERVWLLRLRGEDSSVQAIWPTLTVEQMRALATENHAGYARLLEASTPETLAADVTYTNQQGRTYTTRVDDILMHVALHGSYHRGQVAAAVRAAGGAPVNTDYITYVRELAGEGQASLGGRHAHVR